MATVTKFQFGIDFNERQIEEPEPETVEEIPPEPTFSEAELEAARAEGFTRGREDGLKDARAMAEQAMASAVHATGEQLATLDGTYAGAWDDCRHDALVIGAALCRKMVPKIAGDHAVATIEKLIVDFLPKLLDEPRVVIRVAPALLDPLQEHVDTAATESGFGGKIILLAEEGLTGSDCKIEWADGGAVFETERIWQDIEDIVQNYLHCATGDTVAQNDGETPELDDAEADGTVTKTLPQETPNG